MIIKVLILSAVIIAIAFIGLAFKILFVPNGRFPETSVGRNKDMARLGITCVKHDEIKCWKKGGTGGPGCSCG